MSNNKKIIFISSLHRSSERIVEGISLLQKKYDVVTINIGQASKNTKFLASKRYHELQDKILNNVIQGPGVKSSSETRSEGFAKKVENFLKKNIDDRCIAVITDDNRSIIRFVKQMYITVKSINKKIVFFSSSEGLTTEDFMKSRYGFHGGNFYFDYLLCFGDYDYNFLLNKKLVCAKKLIKVGIPQNDKIYNTDSSKSEYILLIPNYVVLRPSNNTFDHGQKHVFFDRNFVQNFGFKKLQTITNKKILIKLKPRLHENMNDAKKHVSQIFHDIRHEVVTDTLEDDIVLISKAHAVISYGTGMCLKSIMMNKPTVIIKGLGYLGLFNKYYNTVENKEETYKFLLNKVNINKNNEFLENIECANSYNASETFYKKIDKVITGALKQ